MLQVPAAVAWSRPPRSNYKAQCCTQQRQNQKRQCQIIHNTIANKQTRGWTTKYNKSDSNNNRMDKTTGIGTVPQCSRLISRGCVAAWQDSTE